MTPSQTACAWFVRWGRCVAVVDYAAAARALFDPAVVGFGTFKNLARGLDALETDSWRRIWPAIENFRFDLNSIRVLAGDDGLMALGMVTSNSAGSDDEGTRCARSGRATVGLKRTCKTTPRRGVHTYRTLFPAER